MLYRSHKAKIMLYLQVIPCTEAKESLDLINEKLKPHKIVMALKICEYIISFNQYLSHNLLYVNVRKLLDQGVTLSNFPTLKLLIRNSKFNLENLSGTYGIFTAKVTNYFICF